MAEHRVVVLVTARDGVVVRRRFVVAVRLVADVPAHCGLAMSNRHSPTEAFSFGQATMMEGDNCPMPCSFQVAALDKTTLDVFIAIMRLIRDPDERVRIKRGQFVELAKLHNKAGRSGADAILARLVATGLISHAGKAGHYDVDEQFLVENGLASDALHTSYNEKFKAVDEEPADEPEVLEPEWMLP